MIELMIVLAIVAVLAAVAIPEFQAMNERAVQAEGLQIVSTIAANELGFYVGTGRYGTLMELGLDSLSQAAGGGASFSGIVNGTSGKSLEIIHVGHFKIYLVDWSHVGEVDWSEEVTLAHRYDVSPDVNTLMTGAYLKKGADVYKFQLPFGVL